eukprot:TRINITY_DN2397_c0_g1_i1.p1 TRINITY_DN2397_c0_g1~~TRINITY_DN2397_c0_g1_i1.p1  ORF type:complete len:200 (-),score=53.99 TRINITY_DN2397_c0_g1_i1:24-623(-)
MDDIEGLKKFKSFENWTLSDICYLENMIDDPLLRIQVYDVLNNTFNQLFLKSKMESFKEFGYFMGEFNSILEGGIADDFGFQSDAVCEDISDAFAKLDLDPFEEREVGISDIVDDLVVDRKRRDQMSLRLTSLMQKYLAVDSALEQVGHSESEDSDKEDFVEPPRESMKRTSDDMETMSAIDENFESKKSFFGFLRKMF